MTQQRPSTQKRREIAFCHLHPDPDQAHTALLYLSGMDEIDSVRRSGKHRIEVMYDLYRMRLLIIHELLEHAGFHLDNSLLPRMKRSLYHYTEQVEFENLRLPHHAFLDTTEVFINRYRNLRHGCRDERPEHWRHYL